MGIKLTFVEINVHLKPEVLDPQGKAILNALDRLGLEDVLDVRQGKQFKVHLNSELTPEKLAEIQRVAETLLSNPVIEDYSIEAENES